MRPRECAVCGMRHRLWRGFNPSREVTSKQCLDCHGPLLDIGPYVYKCSVCRVKHSSQFGDFTRSNTLRNSLNGVETDYSAECVLSVWAWIAPATLRSKNSRQPPR
jgi:hypothetical protein